MKISIITATFNSEKTLAKNLKSIAMQNYPNIEHIFIDNLSTDGTLSLIRNYAEKNSGIQVVAISERDSGISNAFNKGIKRATGDIIFILNSDDFLLSENTLLLVAKNSKQTHT